MKFVGKTSVAVIKSAILGAFANELFFPPIEGRESEKKGEEWGAEKKRYLCTTGTLRSSESQRRQSGLY